MMDEDVEANEEKFTPFRPFTRDTLARIEARIQEEEEAQAREKEADSDEEDEPTREEEAPKPNPKLAAGSKLPPSLEDYFEPEHVGRPLEDIDEFYQNKKTFCVIGKDKTIYRFSATDAFFVLSPFNPIRRVALYILTNPLFSLLVILTIIVNCIFMTFTKTPGGDTTDNFIALVMITIIANCVTMAMNKPEDTEKVLEYVFTAIYTVESVVKMTARGFMLQPFTYLRDPWNWLDFGVIAIAYMTTFIPDLGNLSALRTFRVLRALKTVAVVPGLKTIVGALLEAVIRLRDVGILTTFMLSIFALIGMQLYMGSLRNKCVNITGLENATDEEWANRTYDKENYWEVSKVTGEYTICSNISNGGKCAPGYSCLQDMHENPNYGYTNFDNFGSALLCAFRLMTQDYWENLYMLVLRAEGLYHSAYFILVILLGSFYLVNLILAIVAMSYSDQQKADKFDEEEKAAEKEKVERDKKKCIDEHIDEIRRSLSVLSKEHDIPPYSPDKIDDCDDRISIHSEKQLGDPNHLKVTNPKASSSLPGSPFIRPRKPKGNLPLAKQVINPERQPLVHLESIIPFADDSNAVTPCSDDIRLCKFSMLASRRTSFKQALMESSRRSSYASQCSRTSFSKHSPRSPDKLSMLMSVIERSRGQDHEHGDRSECDLHKRMMKGVCRTPSASNVDPKDIMVVRELIDHFETASGRKSVLSGSIFMEEERLKDKVNRLLCSWECPWWFKKFQDFMGFIILDPFVDLFITLCILVNTAFMASDAYDNTPETSSFLENGNRVFSYIFAVEAFCKIIALGFIQYMKDGWNVFDFIVVAFSFLEIFLANVKGLSVLRSFRLLRVFKLAKSWQTLNMLISIVARTLGALGNLTFVLAIVIFIFAVMGQQLFSSSYDLYYGEDMPDWNFMDFLHSFMIVFRVLCGEWIESMWNCMRAAGVPCVPFFILTYVIGNLVVLNLFLALLLASFSTDDLGSGEGEEDEGAPNKLAEAINRFSRFGNWVKVHLIVLVKRTKEKKRPLPVIVPTMDKNNALPDGVPISNGNLNLDDNEPITPTTKTEQNGDALDGIDGGVLSEPSTRTPSRASEKDKKSTFSDSDSSMISDDGETQSLKKVDPDWEPDINTVDFEEKNEPDDCFCSVFKKKCACCVTVENSKFGQKFWQIRCVAFKIVQHKYFETFIITMILTSSMALALEDVYLPDRLILRSILEYMDKFFTVIFIIEMLIKWLAYGFKYYFTDAWCWLDFIIVAISIVGLAASAMDLGDVEAFKAMRTLRAFRPLRAVSRWEGMKVVVNALIKAIPSIANVLLVCLVFWLIFGIVGVQFFSGKFQKCVDEFGEMLPRNVVANRNACMHMEDRGYSWENADINFDHVLNAYLALFQVATYKGWTIIIKDAVDSPGELYVQPVHEENWPMYLYFVLFIIFGSFFTLNLFIGVIIDNFNQQKKKAGGSLEMLMTEDQIKYYKAMKRMQSKSPIKAIPRPNAGSLEMFMTEDQKKYYNAMKRMQSKSPQKSIPRPTWFPGNVMFDVTTNQIFDILIMVVIMLNMITMMMDHYGQTKEFETVLYWINFSFIVIFTAECLMKLLALRLYYFKIPWNVFDFVVVVLSILGLTLAEYIEEYFVSPTLLRVVRVFRVSRVLRLVKSAKGIRTLLFSLAVSLPALFNIGLLLFLVLFIYAIFGMNFFKKVKVPNGGLDDVFNFQTFGQSIITLFQMCTSAGWDGVLIGLMNDKDCDPDVDCGNYQMAVLYLLTYLIISFLVVVNMYIAVILENFTQATEDVQHGLTPEDFDMYYEKWEKFDPLATQYIPLEKLSDFVDYLEEPLRLEKPNYFLLVKLDIPIFEGDQCYCRDILDALTKNYLGTGDSGELPPEATGDDKKKEDYEVISSTLKRQKEHYAARIIQKAFRNWRQNHGGGDGGDITKEPPPYDAVEIEIPPELNEDKVDCNTEETIEMDHLTGDDDNENMTSEDRNNALNAEHVLDSHNQLVVEVDLKPDSDVVA